MEIKFQSIDDLIANTPNTFKNRKADDKDLDKMAQWVAILAGFLQIKGIDETEFDFLERALGNILPAEIRMLYANIGKNIDELAKETLKFQKFRLLTIENFWIEKGVVVKDYYTDECWFKTDVLIYATAKNTKNPVYGIDLKNGWSLSYEKYWFYQKDDMPLFQKLTTLFANIIIVNKGNVIKTKIKGITGIKRDDKVEKEFGDLLLRLPDFKFYEHTIFYNRTLDMVGWFRAGNAPDFLLGSDSKNNLNSLIAKFGFQSAKFLKNADKLE
ncbi:hypothetical protein [Sphingobacterium suaedae]|uniref:Uncharacterized protein n=1 Tax=Sphingobacterium suaedae TaxID=1686402 RepID=A0ABW5KKI2_9SPHI